MDILTLNLEQGGSLSKNPSSGFAIKAHLASKRNESNSITIAFAPPATPS
jgi:hypothetical protein